MKRLMIRHLAALLLMTSLSTLGDELTSDDNLIEGLWEGYYTCNQGETGVSLKLHTVRNGNVRGELLFYPTSNNPNVSSGSFGVTGNYTQTRNLILTPTSWINKPKNYVAIILNGKVNHIMTTYSGTIPECNNSSFRLRKIN